MLEQAGVLHRLIQPVVTRARARGRPIRRLDRRLLSICCFKLLSPILDVLYGFLGWKIPHAPPEDPVAAAPPVQPAAG
jgi:hypothetical protein